MARPYTPRPAEYRRAPSPPVVLATVRHLMQFPRTIQHGRGTFKLLGPNMTDLARALDVNPDVLRPVLVSMVEAGTLRALIQGTNRVFVAAEQKEMAS